MRKTCISVEALNNKLGEDLSFCKIKAEGNYYDLLTVESGIVCMDGEECEILSSNDEVVELSNSNGEQTTTFKLTKEEYKVATF